MSKIISFKEGKKNLLENRKEKQIPISQKTINQRETKKATPQIDSFLRNGNLFFFSIFKQVFFAFLKRYYFTHVSLKIGSGFLEKNTLLLFLWH